MAPRIAAGAPERLRKKFEQVDERLRLLETTGVPAASVQDAVNTWLAANPPDPGAAGRDGTDGQDGTNGADAPAPTHAQIQSAVDAYIATNPPAAGQDGTDGEDGQAGQNATPAQIAAAVASYLTANPPAAGTNGTNGAPANTLAGTVQVGQNAIVAIALGIREVTVAMAGTVPGERYQAFSRRFKLNGAASWTPGRPAGYTVLDCACNVAGQVIISLNAPLLALGNSYLIECDVVKVNT